jgi:hypothetical protein
MIDCIGVGECCCFISGLGYCTASPAACNAYYPSLCVP